MKFEREVNLKCLIGQFQQGFMTLSGSSLISLVAALLGVAGLFVLALRGSKFGILNTLHLEWLPFYSFCPYTLVLKEYEFSAAGNRVDGFPLAIALATSLEYLRVVGGGRVVLSPESDACNGRLHSEFRSNKPAGATLPSKYHNNLKKNFQIAIFQINVLWQNSVHLIVGLLLQRVWRTRVSRQGDSNTTLGHLMEFSVASSRAKVAHHRQSVMGIEVVEDGSWRRRRGVARQSTAQLRWLSASFDCSAAATDLPPRHRSSAVALHTISLNFESFHSLPLSPVLDGGGTNVCVVCTEVFTL
ncbi:unnamed protein product [Malus baccata var. baccata]